jgi:hypothetical protein
MLMQAMLAGIALALIVAVWTGYKGKRCSQATALRLGVAG